MFLKKIKLAGFKSFVDPTTVNFPSKLSAVVGPNGSGKSNIIDAVSWVMGENSMKYLRGEVLTDVIFNGSTARKPVGQASIELIFDNQDGAITGEYGKYAEISIKRVLTRDSDSTYYLNGTACRRRDILDVFSGTGLGPRSYAIIGQNMVSRIVEAKPDDMRNYLEEAAGISKYKERRHETELRIKHTKENLTRVNDLRSELDRQLNHLKRQASDAERYKTLKQQERVIKSQWHAIQWRQLDSQSVQYSLEIQQGITTQEAHQADLIQIEVMLEQKRHEQRTANETFQEIQRHYYTIGNEIARIEQDIVHHQERRHQWEVDLKQAEKEWEDANHQRDEISDELQELTQEIKQLEPEWQNALKEAKQAIEILTQTEESAQVWQTRWDSFHQQTMKVNQQFEIEQTRIQHLEQKLQAIKHQHNKLQQEQGLINFDQLEREIQNFSKELHEVENHIKDREHQLEKIKQELNMLQVERQRSSSRLDEVRSELQKLRGKQASLEALQQAALGQRDHPILKWLTQHQLDKQPRLAQGIEVEKGWEHAVEKVLGPYLQAICIDQVASLTHKIIDLKAGQLLAFATDTHHHHEQTPSSSKAQLLLSKITSSWQIASLLYGVYIAETLAEALQLLPHLSVNESVITREGIWLSPAWLRVSQDQNPTDGVFQREQELKQLHLNLLDLETTQKEIEKTLTDQQEKLTQLEQKRDHHQQELNQLSASAANLSAQDKAKNEKLTELKRKTDYLSKELEECVLQKQQTETELTHAKQNLQKASIEKEKFTDERNTLMQERENARLTFHEARQHTDKTKEQSHQIEIRLHSSTSQKGALEQTIERMETQLSILTERKQSLEKELSVVAPLERLKETLTHTLEKHVSLETELNTARTVMEEIELNLNTLDQQRHQMEEEIIRDRNKLEVMRLESQSLKIKCETLQDQIKEMGLTLEEVMKELSSEVTAEEWQVNLERLTQRINRLGSINLIAVEEYATCQERKQYLDKQYEDLQESLTTLENAIAKIDRETRARFKETYDKINQRFQELFPLVFGGGHASLELTDENLLEAGVSVMACPPGKRNSSIHLLSGGEKSMTAIALIFSIFHLNPAPVCLLDEVDAALDDMNVSRFCDLVKHMSEKTQFLFISHNKLAIEMAEHLIGITMNEPGVSRLVSVDVQEAISLASA